MCDEWRDSFVAFYDWAISEGYDPLVSTIDRIDNDLWYCPENCRLATMKEQANNKRDTIWIDYEGEKRTMSWFVEKFGIKYTTLYNRLHRGIPIEQAVIL